MESKQQPFWDIMDYQLVTHGSISKILFQSIGVKYFWSYVADILIYQWIMFNVNKFMIKSISDLFGLTRVAADCIQCNKIVFEWTQIKCFC